MISIPVEERLALQDMMTEYCYAVDKLTDLHELLSLFTEDAILDLTDIGLPMMNGKAEYTKFYESVFADMTHHTHYISNFKPISYEGDKASMRAYAEGLGKSKDGNEVHVHVRYLMDFVKVGGDWKIQRYCIFAGMPPPASLDQIHGER